MKFVELFTPDKSAMLGTGYGLIPDLVLSCTAWTLLQGVFFYWPDLTHLKPKREAELDFRNRMVSWWHGVIMIALCSYQFFTVG